jgi:hypothetical protein
MNWAGLYMECNLMTQTTTQFLITAVVAAVFLGIISPLIVRCWHREINASGYGTLGLWILPIPMLALTPLTLGFLSAIFHMKKGEGSLILATLIAIIPLWLSATSIYAALTYRPKRDQGKIGKNSC